MKIVIAPDSFKESLRALEAATAIESGLRTVWPTATYALFPMGDGGEGTVDALLSAVGGELIQLPVTGPLGAPVQASYGLLAGGDRAVMEMAAASGLELVPPAQRNPLMTTSFGTGELIRAALDRGVRQILIGIGGSATVDGGAGMLQALGVRLLDAKGESIGFGGAPLADLESIDVSGMDPRLHDCVIEVACDVDNPLIGPNGAAAIFGPQKGATPEMVEVLDRNLDRFGQVIVRDLGVDVFQISGGGAAGGMGAALVGVLGGKLRPGVEMTAEAVGLEDAIRDADIVFTGEGRVDGQTLRGKTPMGVALIASRYNKPVIVLAGSVSPDISAIYEKGITAVIGMMRRPSSLADAFAEAGMNLKLAAESAARLLQAGRFIENP